MELFAEIYDVQVCQVPKYACGIHLQKQRSEAVPQSCFATLLKTHSCMSVLL